MTVMEHVQDAKPWDQNVTEGHREALRRALSLMEGGKLAHGDLRAPNVLLSGDEGVFIIDFEFSGEEGGQAALQHRRDGIQNSGGQRR